MNNNNQSYDQETTYITSMEELEAYQEKQFEDYLRLNPVDEDGNFEEEMDHPEFADCECCADKTQWNDLMCHKNQWFCGGCTYDVLLLDEYTEEQRTLLSMYADYYNITIEESIYYQTHCHCCGKYVADAIFDETNNQYCNKLCFESVEDYWQVCHKEADCRVCTTWAVQKYTERRAIYNDEYHKYRQIFTALDAFQELEVYNQFYECIPDLIQYFA